MYVEIYRNVETCVLKLPMFWKKAADVFDMTPKSWTV